MASRVAGALLALTAAALLAVSVLVTAWWSGHPTFNGTAIRAKEIFVGPLGATGCNTGGDGACMNVPVDATFETAGYALAGVTALLALIAVLVALLTLKGAAKRKSFAVFMIVGALIATVLAVVLVLVGPKIRTEAPLPFSTGLFVFFGGITSALASSVFAMRATPPARMQLAPARQSLRQMQQPAAAGGGAFDVHALLAEDALRPSSLGPEPMMGRGSPGPVHSPGGALPGPSGPLGASGPQHQPLFSSAPQLRPLYEVGPGQGGTSGFVPMPPPANVPLRAPTPMPRDQISALAGIPTPASMDAQRPVTVAGVNAPAAPPFAPPPSFTPPAASQPPAPSDATDRDLLGVARGAAKPATLPPPTRSKPPSIAPGPLVQPRPIPTLSPAAAAAASSSLPPPPPHSTLAASPPPPVPRLESEDGAFDAMKTYQREPAPPKPAPPKPAPSKPAPSRPAPSRPAVPMPAAKAAALPPPAKPIARPSAAAAPLASAAASAHPTTPPKRLLTEDTGLDTDVSTQAIDEASPATDSFETSTSESTSFAQQPRAPSVSSTMETQPAPPDDADPSAPADDEVDDELETIGREKIAPTDLELPTARPPTETAPSTSPAPAPSTAPSTSPAPAPSTAPSTTSIVARTKTPPPIAPAAEPPAPEKRPETKLPISTAPDSLPPPTEKQAAASGPSPACPQCEAPMAWVEAHLRFYCKSCKMYF